MKIGIDGRTLVEKRTGIGTYVYEIIKKLNEIDKENEYFIYSNKEIFLDFKLNNNFHIRKYNSKIGTIGVYFMLPKILEEDSINLFWGTEHCLPKRNKHTKNIKFLLTVHDVAILKIKNIGSYYNTIIQKLFLKKSCKNAERIITISKSTKNDLKEIFKIDDNKIDVTYLGINLNIRKEKLSENEIKSLEREYDIQQKNFIFFLSTIEPRKNLKTLIKAFEVYKEENKSSKLKLIIAGGLGWKYKNTLRIIENSKYVNDIKLVGYINENEKKYFFENCVCFVYPSLYEGFGIPVLEAMKNNAIVITSNVSSLPEVAEKAAIYINNVYDCIELNNKITDVILMSEEERKKYISLEKEQVSKFTWEKCALETKKIFEKL